jgi:hypothetical protein
VELTMSLDRDAIVRGLRAQGVPLARAEAAADMELRAVAGTMARARAAMQQRNEVLDVIPWADAPEAITWPVRLRLPWSVLISDGDRHAVMNGRLISKQHYREAKSRIRSMARLAVAGAAPAEIPLRLEAAVWLPDNRVHDVVNFAKIVHDGCSTVIYTDDRWLYDARWYRAGVDVDAPRCELTITPIPEP